MQYELMFERDCPAVVCVNTSACVTAMQNVPGFPMPFPPNVHPVPVVATQLQTYVGLYDCHVPRLWLLNDASS